MKGLIYKYSRETAKYENELREYQESKKENIKCKEAIEEAIRTHFDGMHLDTSCVQDIFDEFGYDRTMWVLAATVKNKSFDGRFSNINKGWARTIIPSHLDNYEFDEYAVQSHPAVLNGFIDSVRAEYEALGLLSSEECLKDSYKEDYANKLLILRPEILNDQSRKPAFKYFYAENGFGCDPNSIGRKVFGTFIADGEKSHFSRGDFIGVADKEKLPEWASKRLEAISAPKMKVRIYQINSEKDMKDLEFRDFDFAMSKGGVDPGIYQQVYGGIAYAHDLGELYMQCNTGNSPLGFYGHTMSVSDVIEICEGKDSGFYYVDSFGFKRLDDFDVSQTDHEDLMKVVILENDREPYKAEIRKDIHAMQSIVGGLIEPVYFEENGDALCFCNEEFLLNDSAPNRVIGNTLIHGTCFICGDGYNDEGERDSCSLTDEQINKYTQMFPQSVVEISPEEDIGMTMISF